MKRIHFLPPALALAAAAAFLTYQQRTLHKWQSLHRNLTESPRVKEIQDGASLGVWHPDWSALAEEHAQAARSMDGGPAARLTWTMLQRPEPELLQAIADIWGLNVPQPQKSSLLSQLLPIVGSRAPEATLKKCTALGIDCDHPGIGDEVRDVAIKLAEKDPAAAAAWLDEARQLARGRHALMNPERDSALPVEATIVIFAAASQQVDLAEQRLERLTPEARERLFLLAIRPPLPPAADATIAGLVRQSAPSREEAGQWFYGLIGTHPGFSLERIDQFVSASAATREEKTGILRAALFEIVAVSFEGKAAESLEELHGWALRELPGRASRQIGATAGLLWSQGEDPQAPGLATRLAAKGGGDELLSAFVESASKGRHHKGLLLVADRISDPALRQKAKDQLTPEP